MERVGIASWRVPRGFSRRITEITEITEPLCRRPTIQRPTASNHTKMWQYRTRLLLHRQAICYRFLEILVQNG
jgi:hypothetical protein